MSNMIFDMRLTINFEEAKAAGLFSDYEGAVVMVHRASDCAGSESLSLIQFPSHRAWWEWTCLLWMITRFVELLTHLKTFRLDMFLIT